jgi:hypothetical protein
MSKFEVQLAEYVQALAAFRVEHNLPGSWFATPDHVAIKCADSTDYEATFQAWIAKAAEAQYAQLNGRRLASMRLTAPLKPGVFGLVEWLEVMEPRPEKVGIDPVGIDHMEFKFEDFGSAATFLDAAGLTYQRQENPGHKWLSIAANCHEFKLTDKSLAEVVAAELASGTATGLK